MTTQDDDPKLKTRTRRDGQPDRRSPPEAYQFKKGKSGNPSGRPKASPSVKAVAEAIASEKIKVKRRGKETMITRREAMIESVINEAIRKGDHRALKTLADLMGVGEAAGPPAPTAEQVEETKTLADKLVGLLELFARLKKEGLLVGSDKGMTVAPWVLEEAARRRRPEGPPAPKPETA
jgi:hypothetical protein